MTAKYISLKIEGSVTKPGHTAPFELQGDWYKFEQS